MRSAEKHGNVAIITGHVGEVVETHVKGSVCSKHVRSQMVLVEFNTLQMVFFGKLRIVNKIKTNFALSNPGVF